MRTIFLDMDGVLCDFVGPACEFFQVNNPYDGKFTGWNFIEELGFREDFFFGRLSSWFWRNLPPMPWASELISLCEKHGEVVILTSPPAHGVEAAVGGKMVWMQRFCPKYVERMIFTRSKHLLIRENAVLIDDCEDTTKRWGSSGILFPAPWNSLVGAGEIATIRNALDLPCFCCSGRGCFICNPTQREAM